MDVATLIALLLACIQLVQVGRVSRRTHEAVRATTQQFGNYNVLLLIPELGRIEAEFELALTRPDEAAARKLLQQWRDAGGEARGFLNASEGDTDEFATALQRSLTQATRAKSQLNEGKDLQVATLGARNAMSQACEAGRTFGALVRVDIDVPKPPRTIQQFLAETLTQWKKESARG